MQEDIKLSQVNSEVRKACNDADDGLIYSCDPLTAVAEQVGGVSVVCTDDH